MALPPSGAAAGDAQAQVLEQQGIERLARSTGRQLRRRGDVLAGLFRFAPQGVDQEPLVEGLGLLREGRHHPVTAAKGQLETIKAQLPQAVVLGEAALGKGFLGTSPDQGQRQHQHPAPAQTAGERSGVGSGPGG